MIRVAILRVENLSKAFGGLYAVNNVSFHIDQGEILSIIGPNGAGKSTLFNLITRIYDVTSGKITFQGKDITNMAPYRLASMGLSRTYQNIELFEGLTTLENVMAGGYIKGKIGFSESLFGIRNRFEEKRLRELAESRIEMVGLQQYMHAEAVDLPYGRKRMVEIARALMTSPSILLLDEPAAGLNSQESKQLGEFLLRLRNEGTTILFIEHDMETVMEISDRIVVMNYGEKLAEGTPVEIKNNPDVIRAYLGAEVD